MGTKGNNCGHGWTHICFTSIVSLVLLAYGCRLSITRVRWVGCAGAAAGMGARASRAREGSSGSYAAAKASSVDSASSAFAVRAWRSLSAATPRLTSADAGADDGVGAGARSAPNAGSSDGAAAVSRCTRVLGTAHGRMQMPDAGTRIRGLDASPSGRTVNRRPCSCSSPECPSAEARSTCW